jgi:glycosyltransferase involved in cell wall biosynthesis
VKIAMIGQKGIPATHGGVERHVEELSRRLVALGHDVTVFTRPNYTAEARTEFEGVRLASVPTIGSKHLDAIVHSILCSLRCWAGGYDVVHYHAIGPTLASPIARLRGRTVVATIHGQDWRRRKWGRVASAVLRLGEWMALRVPQATICVSESLTEAYREDGHSVIYIPNGVTLEPGDDTSVLEEFGLAEGGYLLFAGRLVPEKGAHYLVDAYKRSGTSLKLAIAGGSSMSDEYVEALESGADGGVVFVGYQYGARLASLFRHAALFVLPSDLEGLPIVLLEALGYGAPVLASDIAPNVEVLGDEGFYFLAGDVDDLAAQLVALSASAKELRSRSRELRDLALATYDWDRVAVQTAEVYESVLSRP